MKKDIGIGIIGLGRIGKAVMGVNDRPDLRMRVVAVCDKDATLAQSIAKRHHVPSVTTDYVDLMSQPGVDVVAVYSPDHLHFEQVMAALTASKHVVCAEPLTNSLDRSIEIAQEADRRGVKLMVGQTGRWQPAFEAARALRDNGDLGDLRVLEAHYVHDLREVMTQTPWRWQTSQDLVYGGIYHPLDLLRWIGGEITEIHALGHHSGLDHRHQMPDNFLLNLRFENGAMGRVMGLFGCVEPPMPMLGLSLFGTKGSLVNDRVVLDRVAGRPAMTFQTSASSAGHEDEIVRYLQHFEDCLTQDRTPCVDHWEGARTIAACAAVHDSLRTGLPASVRCIGPQAVTMPAKRSLRKGHKVESE